MMRNFVWLAAACLFGGIPAFASGGQSVPPASFIN